MYVYYIILYEIPVITCSCHRPLRAIYWAKCRKNLAPTPLVRHLGKVFCDLRFGKLVKHNRKKTLFGRSSLEGFFTILQNTCHTCFCDDSTNRIASYLDSMFAIAIPRKGFLRFGQMYFADSEC